MAEFISGADPGDQTKNNPDVIVIPHKVQFYLLRLQDLADLKMHVERGLYPVNSYEGVPMDEGLMDLEGGGYKYAKGLRMGILRSMWGTYTILEEMGYGSSAMALLKIHKGLNK